MQNLGKNKKIDFHARTSCSVLEYNFKWTLEDFSHFNDAKEIESPRFYPEFNIPWWLSLRKIDRPIINFGRGSRLGVFWDLSINREKSHEMFGADCTVWFTVEYTKLLKRETVSLKYNESLCRMIKIKNDETNNIMEFALQIKLYRRNSSQLNTNIRYSCLSEDEFKRDIQIAMMDDLEKLYENHLNPDAQLSIDGETLEVHKSILIARSPVFAKMLQQDMMETTNNTIVINDVSMPAMKEVVAFMYGKAKRDYDYDMAMEVYYTADKYLLKQLQEICACILVSNLDMGNAYQILQLADRHCDKGLTKKVIHFITGHRLDEDSAAENLLDRDEKK